MVCTNFAGSARISAILFWVGYYTLATHEMICAGLVVGWLLLFTRTLSIGPARAVRDAVALSLFP